MRSCADRRPIPPASLFIVFDSHFDIAHLNRVLTFVSEACGARRASRVRRPRTSHRKYSPPRPAEESASVPAGVGKQWHPWSPWLPSLWQQSRGCLRSWIVTSLAGIRLMSKENPVKTTVYYSTLTEYVSSLWQDLIQFFKVEKQLKAFPIKSVPTVADFRTRSLGNLSGGHSF